MGLFSKKKEVIDLRNRDADMPIPAKMRERLMAGNINYAASSIIPTTETTNSNSSGSSQDSGGGFFGFFGGADSSSNSSLSSSTDSTETIQATTPIASTQATDFWGNPIATNDSLGSSAASRIVSSNETDNRRISKMLDRLELIEMKLDRIERKVGIKTD
ncbi:MAG: hypothetical protein Q8L27_01425 [archaeon]|nr:hypothetical protein [archaeon]